ncbi:MAG TPA: DUF5063 domain-containing protein [Jiangellaceae bacterium]
MSEPGAAEDYTEFAAEIADQVESFLVALREIARGDDPGSTLSLLLLEVSQLVLAGGRLGAIVDVVPAEQYEPDAGFDPDLAELRERLAELLGPVDDYVEIFDPVVAPAELVPYRLSDDLTDIAGDLLHGLQHYRAGDTMEALWWWQFSYLSHWGNHATAALRGLHSLIAHTRLDAELDAETQAEQDLLADVVTEVVDR